MLLAIVSLLVVAALLVILRPHPSGSSSQLPLPSATRGRTDDSVRVTDFVGAEACAGCHAKEYDAWRASTHALAGGVPRAVPIIASFNGRPIQFRDAAVVPATSGGRYSFTVRRTGRPDEVFTVDAVVGGGHMQGGGTQGFLSRFPDGTYRFLPFDFSRQGGFWFCNTVGRADRGWQPITPSLSLASCADWPPARVQGDEPRFSNCQSCHGSQIAVVLDTSARAFQTRFSSLGISCEACHGPGLRHIALVRDSSAVLRGEIGMTALAGLGKDASLGTCWSCHALKDRLRGGYLSGSNLAEYYSVRLPELGDAAHAPDGRVRTFAYQEGHRYSDCYVNGGMTCTSCHDPHSQQYRDVTGTPLSGRDDDRQCTGCHASLADSSTRHTKHRASSPGSACVSCHMPYLQEPEVGAAVRYARSDHSIAIPRPAFDSTLGIVGACKGCHTDRGVAALEAQIQAWYGVIKPHPRAVDALLRARQTEDLAAAARLLLVAGEQHTAALFAGMAYFLDHFLAPDMESLPGDVVGRLEALARYADIDVRALALASLHFARGNNATVRDFLAKQLAALGADEYVVRARWSITLGYLADKLHAESKLPAAIATYRRALEIEPGDARIYLNLGLTYADAAEPGSAVEQYERSLAIDAVQPLAWVNLGIARLSQGSVDSAFHAYRRALSLNSREPLAYFNLGGLFLRQGALDSAATNFAKAVALDESIAPAHLYLARILGQRGEYRRALSEVEAALDFDSTNADAIAVRDELRRRLAR